MAGTPKTTGQGWTARLDAFLRERHDIVLMAPFLVYLLLLGVRDLMPYDQRWIASLIRGIGALVVVWLVRKHLPPLGKPHWGLAIIAGAVAALLWAGGQHLFNAMGIPSRLPLFGPPPAEVTNPHDLLGADDLFWATVVTRILVAVTTVAIVEELFWRGFMLRAFINWSEFERVPLGKFTWWSFLGTSLLSTLQHPDNWVVSIFCWMFFNLLFYWKKSLLFLMLVHGLTNLFLYLYVVRTGDWIFW